MRFGGLLKAGTKKFDTLTRRIFTIGIKRTWAMRSGTLTLLLAASTSAGAAWILAHSFFDLSSWLSILASIVALFFVPRLHSLRPAETHGAQVYGRVS